MVQEVADGIVTEPVLAIDASHAPDAPGTRPAQRAEHPALATAATDASLFDGVGPAFNLRPFGRVARRAQVPSA